MKTVETRRRDRGGVIAEDQPVVGHRRGRRAGAVHRRGRGGRDAHRQGRRRGALLGGRFPAWPRHFQCGVRVVYSAVSGFVRRVPRIVLFVHPLADMSRLRTGDPPQNSRTTGDNTGGLGFGIGQHFGRTRAGFRGTRWRTAFRPSGGWVLSAEDTAQNRT